MKELFEFDLLNKAIELFENIVLFSTNVKFASPSIKIPAESFELTLLFTMLLLLLFVINCIAADALLLIVLFVILLLLDLSNLIALKINELPFAKLAIELFCITL